jgi:hypothetical protein
VQCVRASAEDGLHGERQGRHRAVVQVAGLQEVREAVMSAPDGRVQMTAEALEKAIVWGADGTGTVGVNITPMHGKFDIALGIARRERQSGRRASGPPKVSVSNAAGMTVEDAERVYERLGEVIAEVRHVKRMERKERDAGRDA